MPELGRPLDQALPTPATTTVEAAARRAELVPFAAAAAGGVLYFLGYIGYGVWPCLLVFLAPPSWDELVRRLIGRGTESPEEQHRRLATAKVELASQDEFDARVVNSTVAEAAREVVDLMQVRARRPRRAATSSGR